MRKESSKTDNSDTSVCHLTLTSPWIQRNPRMVFLSVCSPMVHSSITDHIDPDGAKCCNSNLPYPMLMKLSGQTNSLLSCVVFEKKSGNSFENILKSGVTSRGVGFHKSRIVFLPEHISQTSPLPADEEGGSSHLLQSEIPRNCSEVEFCPRTWKQWVFLRRNCFFICSCLPHSALMVVQKKHICGKVTEQNLNWSLQT